MKKNSKSPRSPRPKPSDLPALWKVQGYGLALFVFVPVVLYLLVGQPRPLGVSLAVAVGLFVLHRFLAIRHMRWVAPEKCLWSNRVLEPNEATDVVLQSASQKQAARCVRKHRGEFDRFFGCLWQWRWPLRVAVLGSLAVLLGALVATVVGATLPVPLAMVTAAFQLVVGMAVSGVAWGYRFAKPAREPFRVPFPLHNFFLLGVAPLLWIFRIVGLAWIVLGAWRLFGAA